MYSEYDDLKCGRYFWLGVCTTPKPVQNTFFTSAGNQKQSTDRHYNRPQSQEIDHGGFVDKYFSAITDEPRQTWQ
jgi:hypothetical protein